MPELPDLVHVQSVLSRSLRGQVIAAAHVGDPVVLRIMVAAPFPALLVGQTITSVTRRGPFLDFALDSVHLVVNAMLSGRYWLVKPDKPTPRALILALILADGNELRYSDETRMGKIYVAAPDQLSQIPGLSTLGVDLLSDDFTLDRFRALARRRRDQVRQFLLDKTALAAIGNAYADEILFASHLHPKTFCHKLAPTEVDELYLAIKSVLDHAIQEIQARDQPVDVKLRDFLKVRGRAGQPCPTCAATIRRVRVGRDDACFCPRCQPTERKLFVDFRKVPGSR